jgi:hypothetical protein
MDNLTVAAWMVRYAVRSLIHNLEFVPADRLDWKPEPGAKSALEIAGEVAGNLQWCLPILRGGEWDTSGGRPRPETREEARSLLTEAADEYAAALEAAGPELDRMVNIAGGPLWAPRAALIPVLDLLHHHGQICYLQTLLGDREQHWNEAAIAEFFGRDSAEPPA